MKKITSILLGIMIAGMPVVAGAAGSVKVFPTTGNGNGRGTLSAKDLYTTINYDGKSQSETGQPLYDLSDAGTVPTTYQEFGNPVFPYRYTLSGNCAGTISAGESVVCEIRWEDDAKPEAVKGAPVAPKEQPKQVVQPIQTVQVPVQVLVPEDQVEIMRLQLILIDLLKQLIELLTLKAQLQ